MGSRKAEKYARRQSRIQQPEVQQPPRARSITGLVVGIATIVFCLGGWKAYTTYQARAARHEDERLSAAWTRIYETSGEEEFADSRDVPWDDILHTDLEWSPDERRILIGQIEVLAETIGEDDPVVKLCRAAMVSNATV